MASKKTAHAIYFADSGPASGPIQHRGAPVVLGVLEAADASVPVGRARLVGWVFDACGPVATFRLSVGAQELPDLFTCVDRQFREIVT